MQPKSSPRGLTSRSLIAVVLFALATVPGWTLGDVVADATGSVALDWLVTCVWTAVAVRVMAPWGSYRPRDGWLGLIPIYGLFVACVLCWRVALLPYRDWEPREDELWRARWLTGDLLGLWRADPAPAKKTGRAKRVGRPKDGGVRAAGTGPAAVRRSR